MAHNEQKLSDVLRNFARTMATDFPIQGILDHLVGSIVDILPITAAGVTIITPGSRPEYMSASNASALRWEQLQTDLAEGPCLLACASGEAVVVPEIAQDHRFPSFTPQAVAAGLAAVFTFPLRHGETQLGALDLYRDTPGALEPDALTAAQTLADVTAAYLINAQAREDLQNAWARTKEESLHDGLTGLPNREMLVDRLEQAFRHSRAVGRQVAVLFIDVDRLKSVNDAYGHRTGDLLLVAVAGRLGAVIRPTDFLARLSGDEFVVVCADLEEPGQAEEIGTRLLGALGEPFRLGSIDVGVTGSIGLAYSSQGGHTPEHLLHEADVAMFQAKRDGGDRQQVFDSNLRHLVAPGVGFEIDLMHAVDHDEIRNEYQPIVATSNGRITGFEALLRWSHPKRGEVPPSVLIPLAERSDLINDIGRWVLQRAWADRRGWIGRRGQNDLAISVNVSAHQIMSEGFADAVATVLDSDDTKPDLLTLEITESVFLRDSEYALSALGRLRRLGVKLALDDFGTGYSSLRYFKRFPVDIIKVDQSFVVDLAHNRASRAIVGAVVRLAHDLGMQVTAEGVETADHHRAVSELGCDSSQGFYFGRPMSRSTIESLLHHHLNGNDLSRSDVQMPVPRTPASSERFSPIPNEYPRSG